MNTEIRKNVKSDSEKKNFELMNNVVFRKNYTKREKKRNI